MRTRHFAPSIVLAAVTIAAVIAGPFKARQIAYAKDEGKVERARETIAQSSGALQDLNQSFRAVAQAVEPSVVHVEVWRKAVPQGVQEYSGDPFGGQDDLFNSL